MTGREGGVCKKERAGRNPGLLSRARQEVRNKESEMGRLAESEGIAYRRAKCDSAGVDAVKVGEQ